MTGPSIAFKKPPPCCTRSCLRSGVFDITIENSQKDGKPKEEQE